MFIYIKSITLILFLALFGCEEKKEHQNTWSRTKIRNRSRNIILYNNILSKSNSQSENIFNDTNEYHVDKMHQINNSSPGRLRSDLIRELYYSVSIENINEILDWSSRSIYSFEYRAIDIADFGNKLSTIASDASETELSELLGFCYNIPDSSIKNVIYDSILRLSISKTNNIDQAVDYANSLNMQYDNIQDKLLSIISEKHPHLAYKYISDNNYTFEDSRMLMHVARELSNSNEIRNQIFIDYGSNDHSKELVSLVYGYWLSDDPLRASEYVVDLKNIDLRNILIPNLSSYLRRRGFDSEARNWDRLIQPPSLTH